MLSDQKDAIKKALEMKKEEKATRLSTMAQTLDDRNIFKWAKDFIEGAIEKKGRVSENI